MTSSHCQTVIPSGFLECPACCAIFKCADYSAPQFAMAAATSAAVAQVKVSEVRKARRELYGTHFEKASQLATILKRVQDIRTHKAKWDGDGAYRQTMANRGYIRDLLGVRTKPCLTSQKWSSSVGLGAPRMATLRVVVLALQFIWRRC